ncbi:non-specific lipid-transfer protein 13-like [Quillaja saponaria]|uniref:Non-specific lipid-transfer protein 13-like n=1 Tax=Quillaja saponaria TaxID=32244 RepID=A0AAD7KZ76_QUISA|nr:non-specific lipid-transfer protein 13-like [Quillaja saponaria]
MASIYKRLGFLILFLLVWELSTAKRDKVIPRKFLVCERVFEYFSNCIEFLVADPLFPKPSKRCCQHIVKLNQLAKHRLGPGTICQCIQYLVTGNTPPILASRITDLPIKCKTHLSFPISDRMDCSKVR